MVFGSHPPSPSCYLSALAYAIIRKTRIYESVLALPPLAFCGNNPSPKLVCRFETSAFEPLLHLVHKLLLRLQFRRDCNFENQMNYVETFENAWKKKQLRLSVTNRRGWGGGGGRGWRWRFCCCTLSLPSTQHR